MSDANSNATASNSGHIRRNADFLLVAVALIFSFSTLFDLPDWVFKVEAILLLAATCATAILWACEARKKKVA